MGKIFIAFGGPNLEQTSERIIVDDGFECWNLQKIGFIDFVNQIREVIPPCNNNIVDENYVYGNKKTKRPFFPEIYDRCSWGLLLPHNDDRDYTYEQQVEFILNLYSSEFLHPFFVVHDMGIEDRSYDLPRFFHDKDHTQNQAHLFQSREFVEFYKTLLPLSNLFAANSMDVDRWTLEMSRIGMACSLFDDLKSYLTKNPMRYQKEYQDICVILEILLLNEGEEKKKNISWRSSILLSSKFKDSKGVMKNVYEERSKYVHGNTFKVMKRYSLEKQHSDRTIGYNKKHWDLTRKATTYLRHLLVAYLYLYSKKKDDDELNGKKNVDLLTKASGNLYLSQNLSPDEKFRRRIRRYSKEILDLMP